MSHESESYHISWVISYRNVENFESVFSADSKIHCRMYSGCCRRSFSRRCLPIICQCATTVCAGSNQKHPHTRKRSAHEWIIQDLLFLEDVCACLEDDADTACASFLEDDADTACAAFFEVDADFLTPGFEVDALGFFMDPLAAALGFFIGPLPLFEALLDELGLLFEPASLEPALSPPLEPSLRSLHVAETFKRIHTKKSRWQKLIKTVQ